MTLASLLPQLVSARIVLVVFGLGLHSTRPAALGLFRDPPLLFRSLLSLIVIMPLVAAGLVVAFDCPMPVKIALLALAVSPVPPILPKKESKAGGDDSYAIAVVSGR